MPIIENLSSLKNCTPDKSTYPKGKCIVILTANEGFIFNDKNVDNAYINSTWGYYINSTITQSSDNKTLTFDFDNDGNDFTVEDVTLIEGGSPPDPPPVEKVTIKWNYSESSGSNPELTFDKGYIYTNVVTANEGWELVLIEYENEWGITNQVNDFINNNTVCNFQATLNENFIFNVTTRRQVEKLSTFCNLYKVNNDILNKISKERFVTVSGVVTDYGQYIYNLYSTPFIIPDSMIPENQPIQLGNLTSSTHAPVINGYTYKVSLGNIIIPEVYNNSFDYVNTEVKIYTPFNNPFNIDGMYCINQTLSIYYNIDLYTGIATLEVYSSFTNELIYSSPVTVGIKMPHLIQIEAGTINSSIGNLLNNGINKCYAEISRNVPCNIENNPFGSECMELVTLKCNMGYIEIQDIILNIPHITPNELDEIKSLLNNGVII